MTEEHEHADDCGAECQWDYLGISPAERGYWQGYGLRDDEASIARGAVNAGFGAHQLDNKLATGQTVLELLRADLVNLRTTSE